MELEWDHWKSERNRLLRDLPFALAPAMFDGPTIEHGDERRDYGEERVKSIGEAGGVILACVWTERGEVRRIISLRRANRRERDAYRAAVSA